MPALQWRPASLAAYPIVKTFAPFVVAIFGLLAAPAVAAPSFDCSKASTPVQQAICQDTRLAELDRELAALHDKLRTGLAPPAAHHLQDDQLRWLAGRDRCRGEAAKMASCLQEEYENRLAHLKAIARFDYPFISEQRIADSGKGGGTTYEIDVRYPQFDKPGVDFSALNRKLAADARKLADAAIPGDKQSRNEGEWFVTGTYELDRPGPRAVSVRFDAAGFTGGAHGFTTTTAILVDLQSGRAATIDDILEQAPRWLEVLRPLVAAAIQKEIDENSCFEMPDAQKLAGMLREAPRWVFGSDRLQIVFNAYEIGPYVCGSWEFESSYAPLKPYLRADGPLGSLR